LVTLSLFEIMIQLGVNKKTKKLRKLEKNNRKNQTVKKNQLNRLKFWKKWLVRFWFHKSETEKTEPNPNKKNWNKPSHWKNRARPEKTERNRKNWVKPVWTSFCPKKLNRAEPNRTETSRFEPVSVFFFEKNFSLIIFFDKN
jgi:hypothetical protein